MLDSVFGLTVDSYLYLFNFNITLVLFWPLVYLTPDVYIVTLQSYQDQAITINEKMKRFHHFTPKFQAHILQSPSQLVLM